MPDKIRYFLLLEPCPRLLLRTFYSPLFLIALTSSSIFLSILPTHASNGTPPGPCLTPPFTSTQIQAGVSVRDQAGKNYRVLQVQSDRGVSLVEVIEIDLNGQPLPVAKPVYFSSSRLTRVSSTSDDTQPTLHSDFSPHSEQPHFRAARILPPAERINPDTPWLISSSKEGTHFAHRFAQTPQGELALITDMGQEPDGAAYRKGKNDDALFFWKDPENHLHFATLDGVGGSGDGARASYEILESWSKAIAAPASATDSWNWEKLFLLGHQRLKSAHLPEGSSAATAAASISPLGELTTAHAGDVRVMVFRGGKGVFSTLDHSVWGLALRTVLPRLRISHPHLTMGEYMEFAPRAPTTLQDDQLRKQFKNVSQIFSSIKQRDRPEQLDQDRFLLKNQDWVVMGSDGLWDTLNPVEVAQLLSQCSTPTQATALLRETVRHRVVQEKKGKPDNIAIIVYQHSPQR